MERAEVTASWSAAALRRVWPAATGLAVLLGTQIALHVRQQSLEIDGPVSLAEIEAAGEALDSVAVDLQSADRRPKEAASRRIDLPESWYPRLSRRPPDVLVFVDRRPVPVSFFDGATPPRGRAEAYYFLSARESRKRLAVRCYESAECGRAVVVRADALAMSRIALARAQRLGWATGAALACAAGVLLCLHRAFLLAPWPGRRLAALGIGAAGAAVIWAAVGVAEWRVAASILIAEVVVLGGPALRSLAAAWRGTALPWIDGHAARVEALALDRQAHRWLRHVPSAGVLLLFLPLAVRRQPFFVDWANNLYYVTRQLEQLHELDRPSYFLHSDLSGAFYPLYLFYGGSLYAFTALLAFVLRSPFAGYVAAYAIGFACAYGGLAWLGRLLGLAPFAARLGALTYVSSAYYLTNAYGRGSWPEFMATSAIPLVGAAAASILSSPRVRPRDLALLMFAEFLLTGSHVITVVWGHTFLVVAALIALGATRPAVPVTVERIAWLAGAALCAVLLNAWTLAGVASYASATHVGAYSARGFGSDCLYFNVPGILFHLGRKVPAQTSTPELYVQASVYAILWSLVAGAACLRATSPRVRTLWLGAVALLAAFLALISIDRWTYVPKVYKIVQFHFRLNTYVALLAALLVMLALRAARDSRWRRLWGATAVVAVGLQLGLGAYQAWSARTYYTLEAIVNAGRRVPPTLLEAWDYRFITREGRVILPGVVFPEDPPPAPVDIASVAADRAPVVVPADLGSGPFTTNVSYSPLIAATGDVEIAGRTMQGWTVIRRRAGAPEGEWRGAIVARWPAPIAAGRYITLAAPFLAAALLWRARRAQGAVVGPPQ